MIGYHYTTLENYQDIKINGLQLKPLIKEGISEKYIKDGCIWVYQELFFDLELLGQLFYVSQKHKSTKIVCLKVKYVDSVRKRIEDEGDEVKMKHSLTGIGWFKHEDAKYDLVLEPIKKVKLIDSWDLRSIL